MGVYRHVVGFRERIPPFAELVRVLDDPFRGWHIIPYEACLQGTTKGGIGFLIAGVPGAVFLGLLTFFLSFIPMGPPLVWAPVTLWVAYVDRPAWAVFMGLWGFFIVSGVDNVIKPYLISQSANLPFVLVLLGVLGGVLAFGFIGIFLGPILLAIGYSLVLEWIAGKATPGSPPPAGGENPADLVR